jgi:hypothetical protein
MSKSLAFFLNGGQYCLFHNYHQLFRTDSSDQDEWDTVCMVADEQFWGETDSVLIPGTI